MIYTSEEQLVFLVNGCVNVDNENIEECKTAIGLKDDTGVYNSKNQSEWDIRYNYLLYNAEKYGFQCVKIERTKLWTAIAAFNAQTKELFLFFKERTLKKIMNNPSNYHYLTILNSINSNLIPIQLNFFDSNIDPKVNNDYEVACQNLISDLNIVPESVIACSFTKNSFKANIFNNYQQLSECIDLSYLIEPDYKSILNITNTLIEPPIKKQHNKQKLKQRKRIVGLKK